MGQTLTHGIYLPDEGERNCYAGLAANWQILDNSVGTIAEHTTALSGKAPLVHTHTKSDITDFPAYGTTAGTICEGNDSRLSDARTPVAHTHTKSDVTDLLNSNFIPSANNSYDLGSSSYQWNNAYIKSLTINGVACGDILTHNASEFVGVTGNQTIDGVKTFSNDIRISKASSFCNIFSSGYIKGQAPTSNIYSGVRFFDDINSGSTNNITGGFEVEYNKDGYNKSYISSRNYAGENHKVFTVGLRVPNDDIRSIDFLPSVNGIVNLGISTNQWKSVYAQSYYYNGTEFQSKFVTTDTAQTVNGIKTFTAYVGSIGSSTGDEYSSNTRTNLWLMGNRDTQEVSGVLFDTYRQNTAQGTGIHILGISIKENSVRYEGCRWGWYWDNNLNGYTFDFKPTTQGANQALKHNLGTSTDKWDTLNGINPGALSLPNYSDTTYIDISGSIVPPTGETEINKNLGDNQYTPPVDGWLSIRCDGAKYLQIYRNSYNCPGVTSSDGVGAKLVVTLPVRKNVTYTIRIKKDSAGTEYYQLYPCLGNV